MNINFIIILFFYFSFSYCQTTDYDSIFKIDKIHYLSLGLNSDVVNNLTGFKVSNGVDEKPLIHFEDLNNNILYKFSWQTDFNSNNSYNGFIGWNSPSKRLLDLTVMLLAIDYSQREIKEELFFQRKFNFISDVYVKTMKLTLVGKIGLNEINSVERYGGEIGVRKSFRGIYVGSNFGIYSELKTVSLYTQFSIYKEKLFVRLNYENIQDFNSLDVGLHYFFRLR